MTEGAPWKQRIGEILSRRKRKVVTRAGFRPAAVLVPVYEKVEEHYIVLTKRTSWMQYHKGQVSFPGGAYDEDDGDLEATALREAYEEIGVRAEDVELLGNLDDQATLTSHFIITPFVGAIPYPYDFRVNRKEVEDLIEAPVAALLDPACFSTHTPDSEGRLHPWSYYRCGNYEVTGITAIILRQFLDLIFS